MLAQHEIRRYQNGELVWAGKYKNLTNLPHWHYDGELIYCESGAATVAAGNKNYKLSEGMSMFIAPKTVHHIRADKGAILSFLLFDQSLIVSFTASARLENPLLKNAYGIPGAIGDVLSGLMQKPPFYQPAANCKAVLLLCEIFRGEQLLSALPPEKRAAKQYRKLLQEIDGKYAFFTFSDAARFMSMSEPYFSRFFKKHTGMPFSDYLNYVKTEKAVAMISCEPSMKKTEISLQCGFDTIRNFNRVFKKLTGYTPKDLPPDFVFFNTQRYGGDENSGKTGFDPTGEGSELV